MKQSNKYISALVYNGGGGKDTKNIVCKVDFETMSKITLFLEVVTQIE